MREVFKSIHGESLREGKDCVKTLASEMKFAINESEMNSADFNLPDEIIYFFAKLCIFFRIRHLNKKIDMERKKTKSCNKIENKSKKIKKYFVL